MPYLFSARRGNIFHIALAVALALPVPSLAVEAPLTLAEAQRLAVIRSRQLLAHDFAAGASREMAVAAAQLPDPVLKVGVDNLPVSGAERFSFSQDFMTMRRVGVMQELTRADKRQLRAARFEREAELSLVEKNVTTAAIERDTALAWLDRYYAEAAAAVAAEQTAQAALQVEAAEGAYRAGRGTQADLLAARSALGQAEDRASDFVRRLRNATTMLGRWIGAAAELPLGGQPDTNQLRLDPARLEADLAHHPAVAVLSKREDIAATDARLAQANRNADWSVEVAYQQRGPAYSNMMSVGVSVPLQWDRKNRQDRELAAKIAVADQARAERDERLRAHVAETRAMLDEWQNNRQRQERYQRELIPLARERTSAVMSAYRGAKSSLADVLAARRNETDVRLQALQLDADTARLWAQLNFLFPTAQREASAQKDPK
jgi:outer membrane protein TolC